ncbi:hypothetical protein [Pontivivens ytuae]|uniref:Uncharacterized protein n=1 Tax=Pontivivens ytuae TaxID=2789856 RepID=A0A7S9LS74_9RHOB|nr:hypothetical protein [Pontivivens ytuae]QPH54324.1 hypothetical protein I0K15_00660 [Pontivivens ytuae]
MSWTIDDHVHVEFVLGIGATFGYGIAVLAGLPAYLFYFRQLDPVRVMPFIYFALLISMINFYLFGIITIYQSGSVLALLSVTYLGYSLLFALSTAIAVSAFYMIAFYSFGKRSQR